MESLMFLIWFTVFLIITVVFLITGLIKFETNTHVGVIYAMTGGNIPNSGEDAIQDNGNDSATFNLLGIFHANIPPWMAVPPFSYAIALLIVSVSLSLIFTTFGTLITIVIQLRQFF